MILCFNRQKVEIFKEKHKIIDVPFLGDHTTDVYNWLGHLLLAKEGQIFLALRQLLNEELIFRDFLIE